MKRKLTLLIAWGVTAMVLSGSPAKAASQTFVFTNLGGTVRIQQELPCGELNQSLAIQSGRLDLIPAAFTRDGATFQMTRLEMFLEPFRVECMGLTAVFDQILLRLAGAVIFPAELVGGDGGHRLYRFMIPKEKFLILEEVYDNAPVPQPETMYRHPSEDVTGLIDLIQPEIGPRSLLEEGGDIRPWSAQLHVVLEDKLNLRGGCAKGCRGTQTSDILATINDALIPPTVTCTAVRPPGNSFRVFAEDASSTPLPIMLGSYELSSGDVIQLQQTGQPGVRMLETTRRSDMTHFQAGPGENFIIATDSNGLSAIAYCNR